MQVKDKEFFVVQRALSGDQAAYTYIFNKYYRPIKIQVAKYIRDSEYVHDITMEAFEKAFSVLEEYKPDYQLNSWLSTIATNMAINYLRKNKGRRHISIEEEYDESDEYSPVFRVVDTDELPYEKVNREQRAKYVVVLLQQLPPKFRRVLELRYINECEIGEMCEMLDMTPKAVKTMIHRAKDYIRGLLNKNESGEEEQQIDHVQENNGDDVGEQVDTERNAGGDNEMN